MRTSIEDPVVVVNLFWGTECFTSVGRYRMDHIADTILDNAAVQNMNIIFLVDEKVGPAALATRLADKLSLFESI